MAVVNCKVKHIRPKYNNLKEWMEDENNIYIGRAGIVFINGKRYPDKPSEFCNPFKIGKDGTRDEVIEKYKNYIKEKIKESPQMLDKLKGKNLGCWCSPNHCHGDILIELLNKDS